MSVLSILTLVFAVLSSVSIVSLIILLGWFLLWKTFLSKFRLVRELLGQTNTDGAHYKNLESSTFSSGSTHVQNKTKKLRKD